MNLDISSKAPFIGGGGAGGAVMHEVNREP